MDTISAFVGQHIMPSFKFSIDMPKQSKFRKYAYESVNITAQASSPLNERSTHRLMIKWWHFVNTTGKPGKNYSCNLKMEHWNAAFKVHVATAGGNINASTITHTGMALSTL